MIQRIESRLDLNDSADSTLARKIAERVKEELDSKEIQPLLDAFRVKLGYPSKLLEQAQDETTPQYEQKSPASTEVKELFPAWKIADHLLNKIPELSDSKIAVSQIKKIKIGVIINLDSKAMHDLHNVAKESKERLDQLRDSLIAILDNFEDENSFSSLYSHLIMYRARIAKVSPIKMHWMDEIINLLEATLHPHATIEAYLRDKVAFEAVPDSSKLFYFDRRIITDYSHCLHFKKEEIIIAAVLKAHHDLPFAYPTTREKRAEDIYHFLKLIPQKNVTLKPIIISSMLYIIKHGIFSPNNQKNKEWIWMVSQARLALLKPESDFLSSPLITQRSSKRIVASPSFSKSAKSTDVPAEGSFKKKVIKAFKSFSKVNDQAESAPPLPVEKQKTRLSRVFPSLQEAFETGFREAVGLVKNGTGLIAEKYWHAFEAGERYIWRYEPGMSEEQIQAVIQLGFLEWHAEEYKREVSKSSERRGTYSSEHDGELLTPGGYSGSGKSPMTLSMPSPLTTRHRNTVGTPSESSSDRLHPKELKASGLVPMEPLSLGPGTGVATKSSVPSTRLKRREARVSSAGTSRSGSTVLVQELLTGQHSPQHVHKLSVIFDNLPGSTVTCGSVESSTALDLLKQEARQRTRRQRLRFPKDKAAVTVASSTSDDTDKSTVLNSSLGNLSTNRIG